MLNAFATQLAAWDSQGLTRTRIPKLASTGNLINFASNDYLGLSQHPAVIAAFKQALDTWGLGSCASQMVCGYTQAHADLEAALCEFTGMKKAILFPCGYMANIGAISSLVSQGDMVFQDKLNHASLIDAGRLSGARFIRYAHGDMAHLSQRLAGLTASRKLIVSEGVFSMDGDIAPLPDLLEKARTHQAIFLLDDSHAFGVLGDQGQGTMAHFHSQQADHILVTGTLGKSFGLNGAFVAGDPVLMDTILQFARTYMFTTALMPAIAVAALTSLELIRTGELTEALQQNIHYFRQVALEQQLPFLPSISAIQPLVVHDAQTVVNLSNKLRDKGFWVGAMRPPTVGPNQSRLRITLSAQHTRQQIATLLSVLKAELVP